MCTRNIIQRLWLSLEDFLRGRFGTSNKLSKDREERGKVSIKSLPSIRLGHLLTYFKAPPVEITPVVGCRQVYILCGSVYILLHQE
jgi:hypothetical protein